MASRDININVRANVVNVSQAMSQVANSVNTATNSVKNMGPPFQNVQKQFTATVSNSKLATTGMNNFGNATTQATGKLTGFGKVFSDNRGIVFGVAGLTSALGEAVGMMGMYGDTALRLAEAQDKLNNLIDKGVTSGKAYTDAQNEVVKQQRFFNMVQRNTILSQMDMIFFTTMVISGLVKLGSGTGKVSQIFQKFQAVVKGVKMEQQFMVPIMSNMNQASLTAAASTTKLGQAMNFLKMHIRGLMAATVIGAVLVGIGLLIEHFMKLNEAAQEAAEKQKKAGDQMKNDLEAWGALTTRTLNQGVEDFKGLSDGAQESMTAIIAAIRKVAQEEKISFAEAQLITAKREKLDAERMATETKNAIERRKLMLIEKFEGRPKQLLDAYLKEDAGLKELNKTYGVISGSIETYKGNIATLEAQIKGLTVVNKDIVVDTSQIGVAFNRVQSSVNSAKDVAFDFLVGLQQKMQGIPPTQQAILDAFDAYVADQVAKNPAVADAWAVVREQIVLITDDIPKVGEAATEAIDTMNTGITAFGKNLIDSLDGEKALHEFWINFDGDIAGSMDSLNFAEAKVKQFFSEFKDEIANGMDPAKEFEKFIAGWPTLMQELMKIKYAEWMKNNKEELKANTKEEKANAAEIQRKKEALMDSIEALSKVGIAATMNERTNKLLKTSYDELVGSILEEGDKLLANQQIVKQLDAEHMKQIQTAEKLMQIEAERIVILEDGFEGRRAQIAAVREGTQAFSDDVGAIEKNNIAADQNRNKWVALVQEVFPFIDTSRMLTEELKTLASEGLDSTTDAAERLARVVDDNAKAAFQDLSSVFTAGNKKDFKKAWKDLDLGSIPKKFKDDFRRMSEEMRGFSEKGLEVKTGLDLVNTALSQAGQSTKEVSFKEIHKTMKEVIKDFGDFAMLDPESWELFHTFPSLFEDLQKHTEKFPLTMALFNQAMREGGFNALTSAQFLNAYVNEGGKLEDISEKDREKLEDLGIQFDENGDPITNATDNVAGFNEEMAKIDANAIVVETVKAMWTDMVSVMMEQNVLLAGHWTLQMISVLLDSITTTDGVKADWSELVGELNKSFVGTANKWETAMKNVLHNSQAASSQTQSEFDSLVKKLWTKFVKIANNWEKAMRNMVQNAKAAASQINSALDGIKDQEVKINYVETGAVPHSKGAVYSFAQGGLISAAGGMNISNGPTRSGNFIYGDNSGGREIQAFIPLDGHKADKIMDIIDAKVGRPREANVIVGGGGDRDIIVPITININGEQYSFQKRYRIRQGQEIASQVL